ncbi:MAG: hypothetical protein OER78_00380 [Nitrosopumilus sp.]|nr:hypothetical protein [Nitrosopumilus sp.]MDH3854605.1 hypothetical protein [Nitrosopumilus sp.]
MTSKLITSAVSSNGKKTTDELGKSIRKLHADYDRQLKNAKTRGKLRQVFQKHKRDHQALLKKHLKTEEMTIKKLGNILDQEN